MSRSAFGRVLAAGFLLVFSTLSTSDIQAAEFRYVAWHFDSPAQSCEAALENFRSHFSALTDLPVTEARCGAPVEEKQGEFTQVFRPMSLVYISGHPISLHTTYFGEGSSGIDTGRPGNYLGSFATWASCEASRAGLSQKTGRATGLPVLASGCERAQARFMSGDKVWVLRVDALLGISRETAVAPKKVLHIQSISGPSSILRHIPTGLQDDVRQRLQAVGASVVHEIPGTLWYFSEQAQAVTVRPFFGLEDDRACERQLSRFARLLSGLGDRAAPTFHCVERTSETRGRQIGVGVWMGRRMVDLNPIALERYTALEDCLADQPRLDRNPPEGGSFKVVLGTVCTRGMSSLDPRQHYEARALEWMR